jgi:hypothetical protein
MRHSLVATALTPLLVAVQPTRSVPATSMHVVRDSCSAVVDSALHVARERIATTAAQRASDSARGAPSRQYFFEFEVTQRAAIVRPDATPAYRDTSAAVVQFVVDAAGVADPASVRVLAAHQTGLRQTDAVDKIRSWSFQPAAVRGCHVAQLVQTRTR